MFVPCCGQTQREQTIHAAFVATNVAVEIFVKHDLEQQKAIVDGASSVEDGTAKLTIHRSKRLKVVALFGVVYKTIAAAALANNDPKALDNLRSASELLATELKLLFSK